MPVSKCKAHEKHMRVAHVAQVADRWLAYTRCYRKQAHVAQQSSTDR